MEGRNFFIKQIFYCFSPCYFLAFLFVGFLAKIFFIILLCLCVMFLLESLFLSSYSASSLHSKTTFNVIYNKNKVLDMHIHRHPHILISDVWCLREFPTMWELKRAKKCKWKEKKNVEWKLCENWDEKALNGCWSFSLCD